MQLLELCQKESDLAYEQECEREKRLNQKTDYLFKWLAIISSVIGLVVPIFSKSEVIDLKSTIFVVLYVLTIAFFVSAMVCIVIVNFPRKTKLYKTGSDILTEIENMSSVQLQNFDIRDISYKRILQKDIILKQLRDNNQKMAKLIIASEILMILGLICISIFWGYLVWGV